MNKKNNNPSYFEKTFGKSKPSPEKGHFSEPEESKKPLARGNKSGSYGDAKKRSFDTKSKDPRGRSSRPERGGKSERNNKPERSSNLERKGKFEPRTERNFSAERPERKPAGYPKKTSGEEKTDYAANSGKEAPPLAANEKMPLNKYIAHCGLCSRRDAVMLIKQGKVKVNEVLVTEPGQKIEQGDVVSVSGKKIVPQKNLAYILLNKPKGFITTTDDEKGRRTIMDLVSVSEELRLFPVGRLDRATTGLILLTNDGDLAQRLSHPKYKIKKIYHVTLNKNITGADYDKIISGLTLEDGPVQVDALSILENKNELGIQIHSGKNRVVRRIFEHLGYEVEKLDRVVYAGLTKKNLPRGKWRELSAHEVVLLKHFKN